MVMTVPSETFSATAAESALRPCSDLVCGRPATRLRWSTPSIKTPSLQSYHSPCIIASCGSNTGVWPQRHDDLYSSLLRYVNIHHYCDMYHYSHRLCQVHVLPGHGTNAGVATDLEERGVRAVDQPATNIIIPQVTTCEWPCSARTCVPCSSPFTRPLHDLYDVASIVHTTYLDRTYDLSHSWLGIMSIVAAIIITCDVYIHSRFIIWRYIYI